MSKWIAIVSLLATAVAPIAAHPGDHSGDVAEVAAHMATSPYHIIVAVSLAGAAIAVVAWWEVAKIRRQNRQAMRATSNADHQR